MNITGGSIIGTVTGQSGNDTVNFNAANGFTTGGAFTNVGFINVDGGTLTLNHALTGTSVLTVDNGATLNQNTNIAAADTTVNGTINLDADTTVNVTRTVTGDFTLGSTGQLIVGATDNGANDNLTVTASAVLSNGAGVKLNVGSAQIEAGDTFQVVTASTLNTTVASLNISSDNNFITLTASTVGSNLVLTADLASTASAVDNLLSNNGITNTASLVNFAGGGSAGTNTLDATNALSSLMTNLQTVDNTTFQTISSQINAFSGQELADALEDLNPDSALMGGNTAAGVAGSNAVGNVVTARLDQARQIQLARKESGLAAGSGFGNDLQIWAQPYGTSVNQGIRDGIEGYDATVFGLLVGGDVQVSDTVRLGVSAGYSDTNVVARGSNGLNGSDIQGYNVNVYGSYSKDAWYVDAMVGAGWSSYDSTRFVTLGNALAYGDFDGNTYSARVGTGYDLDIGNGFTFTPNASVHYTHLETDAYQETGGGGLGINVGKLENDSFITSLGAKFAYEHEVSSGTVIPYVQANWLNENGDDDQAISSSFIGGGQTFVTRSASIERSATQYGAGLDFHTLGDTKLGMHVNYLDRDDVKTLSGALRVRMPF